MRIDKQSLLRLVEELPEEIDMEEVLCRLFLQEKLETSEEDAQQGQFVAHEQVVTEAAPRSAITLLAADTGNLRVQLQPDVAFGNFQRSLQRSVDLAALALDTLPREGVTRVPELGQGVPLHFGSHLPPKILQEQYRAWVLGHALTDAVEALEPLIADLIKSARIATLGSSGAPIGEAKAQRAIEAEDIGKAPLGAKLDFLAKEFPGMLPQDVRPALAALNKLRVCLTHAGGVVRPRDCNTDVGLEVSQVFREFWVEYGDGSCEPLHIGMTSKEEGWIVMRRARAPRVFRVAERISLTDEDLLRIDATIFEIVLELRKNLYVFLREIGAVDPEFREPPHRWNFQAVFTEPVGAEAGPAE